MGTVLLDMAERPEAADLAAVAEKVPLGPMAEVASGALLMDARGRVRHAAWPPRSA